MQIYYFTVQFKTKVKCFQFVIGIQCQIYCTNIKETQQAKDIELYLILLDTYTTALYQYQVSIKHMQFPPSLQQSQSQQNILLTYNNILRKLRFQCQIVKIRQAPVDCTQSYQLQLCQFRVSSIFASCAASNARWTGKIRPMFR
ncbi:hypothetical protein SS50377_28603 [Spironucleus salmonicida]|uniref:Uncharacterized protein n=1 Tax=Spironucleus salmonicida TaxID=348837 RepID=V6LAY5_9EUKA|nr:hypothetical protein SS50377_28603 [Spironucleus salmonicida]|eukprot:EST41577.1 Hypothetical protein SS50377_fx006 [Spironucleus salmonicida]